MIFQNYYHILFYFYEYVLLFLLNTRKCLLRGHIDTPNSNVSAHQKGALQSSSEVPKAKFVLNFVTVELSTSELDCSALCTV